MLDVIIISRYPYGKKWLGNQDKSFFPKTNPMVEKILKIVRAIYWLMIWSKVTVISKRLLTGSNDKMLNFSNLSISSDTERESFAIKDSIRENNSEKILFN